MRGVKPRTRLEEIEPEDDHHGVARGAVGAPAGELLEAAEDGELAASKCTTWHVIIGTDSGCRPGGRAVVLMGQAYSMGTLSHGSWAKMSQSAREAGARREASATGLAMEVKPARGARAATKAPRAGKSTLKCADAGRGMQTPSKLATHQVDDRFEILEKQPEFPGGKKP